MNGWDIFTKYNNKMVIMMQEKWIIEKKVARYVPENEPFLCMFSNGKDSALALSTACEHGGIPAGLIYCDSEEDILSEYVFHWQSIQNVNLQAETMGIPIIHHDGVWYKWDKTIKQYNCRAKYVVFGDLNLVDNLRIQSIICDKAGMTPCFPLWNLQYDLLISELEKFEIETVITTIDPKSKISEEWLGEKFDRNTYNEFKKKKIDPFGEKGEFHTFVINSNLFKRKLQYELCDKSGQYVSIKVY